MKNEMTRQGVRNLNTIKAPPRKKYELPPQLECEHRNMRMDRGHQLCKDCGLYTDHGGPEYGYGR